MPGQLVAPLSGNSAGLRRAEIKPGVREIHLCKDERGKTGLQLKNVDQVRVGLVGGCGALLRGTTWQGRAHHCSAQCGTARGIAAWHGTGHRCMAVRGTKLSTATWSRCQPCAILPSLCPQGIFVQLVKANSPAALVGLRFGDQILQIDGKNCAGWSSDKAQRALKKASPEKIVMVVRDR